MYIYYARACGSTENAVEAWGLHIYLYLPALKTRACGSVKSGNALRLLLSAQVIEHHDIISGQVPSIWHLSRCYFFDSKRSALKGD